MASDAESSASYDSDSAVSFTDYASAHYGKVGLREIALNTKGSCRRKAPAIAALLAYLPSGDASSATVQARS